MQSVDELHDVKDASAKLLQLGAQHSHGAQLPGGGTKHLTMSTRISRLAGLSPYRGMLSTAFKQALQKQLVPHKRERLAGVSCGFANE